MLVSARKRASLSCSAARASVCSVIVLGDESGYTVGEVNKVKLAAIEAFGATLHECEPTMAARDAMAAELIAINPALGPGLGQMLDNARSLGDMSLVLGTILVIMIVGVLIERLVFSPIRQRTLKNRGLLR